MYVKSMFPTPLVVTEIDQGSQMIADLRTTILEREKASIGVTHSNDGGWQSADDFVEWAGEPGNALLKGIGTLLERCTVTFNGTALQRQALNWKYQVWANVNRKGHSNTTHFHPASYWSGTFYVDDGGIDGKDHLGGAIEFTDPRGPVPLMYAPGVKMVFEGCLTAGLSERIYPRTGQLILFPSWLPHSVNAYKGDGTRISIAFNCSLW